MAKHTFTNTADGPRIVNGSEGPVSILPGQSTDVEVSDAELKSAKATEWFDLDGVDDEDSLSAMKVKDLKALAEDEGIDLGDASTKADIISAIELAREEAGAQE
jgi:hypothetical protein